MDFMEPLYPFQPTFQFKPSSYVLPAPPPLPNNILPPPPPPPSQVPLSRPPPPLMRPMPMPITKTNRPKYADDLDLFAVTSSPPGSICTITSAIQPSPQRRVFNNLFEFDASDGPSPIQQITSLPPPPPSL